jgi:hypothetical protein
VKLGNPHLRPGSAAASAKARSRLACERNAARVPFVLAARRAGCTSLREIATAMEARGVRAPGGWYPATVRSVLQGLPPPLAMA